MEKTIKVLFVDDDTDIQVAVSLHLKVISKFDVISAYDGQEALDKIASGEHFDCILLDSLMDGMSGEEFLEKYKGEIPIIYSTAFTRQPPRPVAATLPKPYDAKELGQLIRQVCGMGSV